MLHVRLWGIPTEIGRARIDELAATAGINDLLDRPVSTYSGGQRRRLEIVRALVSEPRVLFLDEPTVGLDTRIRHDLFDAIATLRERTGVTIILTTHHLEEAERLCDRIAIVAGGRVIASDTPTRLVASLGDQVLELRVEEPVAAVAAVRDRGAGELDVLAIGGTVTVALRTMTEADVLAALESRSIPLRAAFTRRPTLDDVYLRLTGDPASLTAA
jgi:ABC-2 type transport system ATP-binding protein